jgi:hypothetical protein
MAHDVARLEVHEADTVDALENARSLFEAGLATRGKIRLGQVTGDDGA